MPGLPILSSKTVIKLLKQTGFEPAPKRGKGSHLAFVKKTPNKTYLVIVPHKNEIPRGTLLRSLNKLDYQRQNFFASWKNHNPHPQRYKRLGRKMKSHITGITGLSSSL